MQTRAARPSPLPSLPMLWLGTFITVQVTVTFVCLASVALTLDRLRPPRAPRRRAVRTA